MMIRVVILLSVREWIMCFYMYFVCSRYISPLKLWVWLITVCGEVYYIQLYVIKFVSVFSEVSVFSVYFSFLRLTSMIRKSEIFLKVALNAPWPSFLNIILFFIRFYDYWLSCCLWTFCLDKRSSPI